MNSDSFIAYEADRLCQPSKMSKPRRTTPCSRASEEILALKLFGLNRRARLSEAGLLIA